MDDDDQAPAERAGRLPVDPRREGEDLDRDVARRDSVPLELGDRVARRAFRIGILQARSQGRPSTPPISTLAIE